MVRANGAAVVERPVGDVFAYLADVTRHVEWQGNVLFVDLLTPPPVGAGSQFLEVSQVLGRRFETVAEVVAYEPPVRFRHRAVDGPVRYEIAFVLTDESAGTTRIELELHADVGDFFGVDESVVKSVAERELDTALGNMKHILEGRSDTAA